MYADTVTPSMRAAIDETDRRRAIQSAYNEEHGIVPQTIRKSIRDLIEISGPAAKNERGVKMTEHERKAEIERLEKEMRKAAKMLEYEYAAVLRDELIRLRGEK
jgi:excinuclease ABC subunit B